MPVNNRGLKLLSPFEYAANTLMKNGSERITMHITDAFTAGSADGPDAPGYAILIMKSVMNHETIENTAVKTIRTPRSTGSVLIWPVKERLFVSGKTFGGAWIMKTAVKTYAKMAAMIKKGTDRGAGKIRCVTIYDNAKKYPAAKSHVINACEIETPLVIASYLTALIRQSNYNYYERV